MALKKRELKENAVYVALWVMMFVAPVAAIYVHSLSDMHDDGFQWSEVVGVWKLYAVYLVVFLVHNYLIAPMLIHRQRKALYFGSVALLLAAFAVWQCQGTGGQPPFGDGEPMDHFGGPPPMRAAADSMPPSGRAGMAAPGLPHDGGRRPQCPPQLHGPGDRPGGQPHDRHLPPIMQLEKAFAFIVFFLMLGMNLGVKYYFKADEAQKEMADVERRSLEQQLAYLKYQINPHFFMNTLNNIHALVDIDPERAKDTIIILSRIMRHVLYEGDRSLIPLHREVDFLNNYVALMKLRFTEKVAVSVAVPDQMPEVGIPPLLLITFVENAFKHGISYRRQSFVDIRLSLSGNRLKFVCRNSKPRGDGSDGGAGRREQEKEGGVGLANVKQRLELLYGKDFALDIDDGADAYEVLLLLPLRVMENGN